MAKTYPVVRLTSNLCDFEAHKKDKNVSLVDAEDLAWLNQWEWFYDSKEDQVVRWAEGGRRVYLAVCVAERVEICSPPPGWSGSAEETAVAKARGYTRCRRCGRSIDGCPVN
jgi:hypothetical protein